MPTPTKPSIVFAHGLWADGSCFSKLIPSLQADGHQVICSQHGLNSLKGDVECVTRCFGRVTAPVVLVGHSYGGALITHAGVDERVAALVYIAALSPDETETSQASSRNSPSQMSSLTSRWRMGGSGSSQAASSISRAICPMRSKSWCGLPKPRPCPTYSRKRSKASPGSRSRAGTLWPAKIAPSIPNWNAPLRSAWARRPPSCDPVTCQCYPNRKPCWMLSGRPQARCRRASDNDAQSEF